MNKTFNDLEIEEAVKISRKKFLLARKGDKPESSYGSDDDQEFDWSGELAEWALEDLYNFIPTMQAPRTVEEFDEIYKLPSDFKIINFDFYISESDRRKIENKTKSGNYPWNKWWTLEIDAKKFDNNYYNIITFCYYNRSKKEVEVLGWNYAQVMKDHPLKEFHEFGETVYSSNGSSFVVRNKHGLYRWPFLDKEEICILNDMNEL
jgi:hypothetical protein